MKKLTIVFLLISSSVLGQFKKIDHIVVGSPDAKKLFDLLHDKIGLRTIWKFQNWGWFDSGGLSIGDVTLELLQVDSLQNGKLYGFALEPLDSIERSLRELDRNGLRHTPANPYSFKMKTGPLASWTTALIYGLIPSEYIFFICEYSDRSLSFLKGQTEFDIKAESLNIQSFVEINIPTDSLANHLEHLKRISNYSFANGIRLDSGHIITLVDKKTTMDVSIVLKVKSLKDAKLILSRENMLKDTNGIVAIDLPNIPGMKFILLDK